LFEKLMLSPKELDTNKLVIKENYFLTRNRARKRRLVIIKKGNTVQ
jgi:hypothetical protein